MPRSQAGAFTITLLLPIGVASAQWQLRHPGTAGLNDRHLAAAYHAATQEIVTVGSAGAASFDGRVFAPRNGPAPARTGAAIAYDRARQRTVLFGGLAAGTATDLGDAWEYDGTSWSQRTPAGAAPAARSGAVLVYDEWRRRCVLVGGFVNGLGQGDTWEWDGTTWTHRPVGVPGLRGGGTAAFDALRGHVLMYGGATTSGGPVRNDFWRYDGETWTRLLPPTVPPARTDAAMAFDRWSGRLLLFGGDDGSALFDDTWEWNGAAWTLLLPTTRPAPRAGHALVLDEVRNRFVLLAGQSAAGARSEAWSWTTDPRPSAARFGSACASRTLDPAPGSLPVLGGTFRLAVGGPPGFVFIVFGFSNLTSALGPLPQPLPAGGSCQLWIAPATAILLDPGRGGAWSQSIPLQPALVGIEFYAQTHEVSTTGPLTVISSNGLDARIGVTRPPSVTFSALDAAGTDPESTPLPGNGVVGGDGRHGTFDPTIGVALGNGVYEFDTEATTIPARLSPRNQAQSVTDGRFFFDSFRVPAGITVRFRGRSPAQIHVRGTTRIEGTLDASGDAMTTFNATTGTQGQAGGRGGPGGGRGGRGGDRCTGLGPTVVLGITLEDGQPGEDVRLPAGHASASAATGTGGPGSPLEPQSGLNSAIRYTVMTVFSGNIAAGGGGGGFRGPGSGGAVQPQANLIPGPNTTGGIAFALPAVPAGTTSLAWYFVGGSGGGGGASHPFASIIGQPAPWRAGAGGSGGGGALALRCGRDLRVEPGGRIVARGGDGVVISDRGDGLPCPGGGGSGGSLLLQASGLLQNLGTLDVSGGGGSRIDNLAPTLAAVSTGGAGAAGLIRLESPQPPVPGTTLPPLTAGDTGPLRDRDDRTGLRSLWLPVGTPQNPAVLERYELELLWNGVLLTFSDDPAVGPPTAANGPIVASFQGTRADAMGNPDPALAGPWRTSFGAAAMADNCNRDVPAFVRIDLSFPASPRPVVQGLRLFWH